MSETRIRSREDDGVLVTGVNAADPPHGGSSASYTTTGSSETIQDVVTQDFHARIENGDIINNPCVYTLTKEVAFGDQDYSVHSVYTPGKGLNFQGNCYLIFFGPPNWGDPNRWPLEIPSADINKAKLDALSSIDSGEFAFGEDLLEIRETMRFLRNPLGSLKKLSRSFRDDRVKHQRKWKTSRSEAIADVWLQYRFAASPLVRSAFDAVNAANSNLSEPAPTRLTSRGFSTRTEQATNVYADDSLKHVGYDYAQERIKASILYELQDPRRNWRFHLGLRAKDIPATTWAVMPYSFMVDRVANVTGFIQAVSNLTDPNVRILAASVTSKSSRVRTLAFEDHRDTSVWKVQPGFTPAGFTLTEFTYDRAVWEPSFTDAIPRADIRGLVDSATKTADLLALIRRRFS